MKKFCLVIFMIFLLCAGFIVGYSMPMDMNIRLYRMYDVKLFRSAFIKIYRNHEYIIGFEDDVLKIELGEKIKER